MDESNKKDILDTFFKQTDKKLPEFARYYNMDPNKFRGWVREELNNRKGISSYQQLPVSLRHLWKQEKPKNSVITQEHLSIFFTQENKNIPEFARYYNMDPDEFRECVRNKLNNKDQPRPGTSRGNNTNTRSFSGASSHAQASSSRFNTSKGAFNQKDYGSR